MKSSDRLKSKLVKKSHSENPALNRMPHELEELANELKRALDILTIKLNSDNEEKPSDSYLDKPLLKSLPDHKQNKHTLTLEQKRPEMDAKTGYVAQETALLMNAKFLPAEKLKPVIAKNELIITHLYKKIKLEEKNLHGQIDAFIKLGKKINLYYQDIIVLVDSKFFNYREFKSNIDEEEQYLYDRIFFIFPIINKLISILDSIINELFTKKQYHRIDEINHHNLAEVIRELVCGNAGMLFYFEYKMPIITAHLAFTMYFDFLVTVTKNQISILEYLEKMSQFKISFGEIYFSSLARQTIFIMNEVLTKNIKKTYQEKLTNYPDKSHREKLLKIFILYQDYLKVNSHNNENKEKIASASKINYFLSFCIANPYLYYHVQDIKNKFEAFVEDDAYKDNELLNAFVIEVNDFSYEMSDILKYLPQTSMAISSADALFIEQYDKFISIDYHLMEIFVSSQEVFYLLNLFIKNSQSLETILLNELHQKQIQLLQASRSILQFLKVRGFRYITKWCYLENETIKKVDIIRDNYNQNVEKNLIHHGNIGQLNFTKSSKGILIDAVLDIENKLFESLSGNNQIREIDFPEPMTDAEIISQTTACYLELMESEKKQPIKKKNELKKRTLTKNKYLNPKITNKNPIQNIHMQENKSIGISKERQSFQEIQKKFNYFVDGEKEIELKSLLTSLLKTNKESFLVIEINDYLAGHFYKTALNRHAKNSLDIQSIKRFRIALAYKSTTIRQFQELPKDDFYYKNQIFLEDEFINIKHSLLKSKNNQKNKLNKAHLKLQKIEENRIRKMNEVGHEQWYNNPNPKNKWALRQKNLKQKIANLTSLKEEIHYAMKSFNFFSNLSATLSKPDKPDLSVPSIRSNKFNTLNYETLPKKILKPELEKEIKISPTEKMLDERISTAIDKFENYYKNLIKKRMLIHGIKTAPDYFFPREIFFSIIRLVAIVKNSTTNHCRIYVTGGFILNLIQRKEIAEQKFNFDVDIITDLQRCHQIFTKNHWNYQISAETKTFSSFKLNLWNVHFDIVSLRDFSLIKDRESCDLYINRGYLSFDDKDLTPFFINDNGLLDNMIDAFLLGVEIAPFIHACNNHLKNINISSLIPEWNDLQQWLFHFSFVNGLAENNFQLMIQTLKCFISDPIRLLRLCFTMRKEMVNFSHFDKALQLCFNHSDQNFFLSLILEGHCRLKKTNGGYIDIFSRYIKYVIKKAMQSVEDTLLDTIKSQAQLVNTFSNMMEWAFEKKYFLEIFTLPIKMDAFYEHHSIIEETCKRLFSNNESNMPIYSILKKQLIEVYTSHLNPELEIKMLPFVLAFVITYKGDIPITLDILIETIAEVSQTFPGLKDLYPELLTEKISSAVKIHLQQFIDLLKENPKLAIKEQKAAPSMFSFLKRPQQSREVQLELSKNSNKVSFGVN